MKPSDSPSEAAPEPAASSRSGVARLMVLFGTLYFIQGVIEPTANLPYQPLESQLSGWRFSAGEIGKFFGIIGIAWSIKPLFGLLSDFFPLGGRRRRPYLLFSTLLAAAAFLGLATSWSERIQGGRVTDWGRWLLEASPLSAAGWLMIAAGIGIAMSDVVIDALAVEEAQPRGITGQIQAVQWGTMSAAALLCGVLGGHIAKHGALRPMFLGCGVLGLISVATVLLLVREPRRPREPLANLWSALRDLTDRRRLATLSVAGLFLFLWNFNPFFSNVLNKYMRDELRLGEVFYGYTASLIAVGNIVACIAYPWYCRRVAMGWLVHGSIVAGIAATLVYWLLYDAWSAVIASLVFGFAYQTATLVQLDLAARICPVSSAGTMFALLMAASNTGNTAGINLGGQWYDALSVRLGSPHLAFDALVLIGAAFTAGCWLLVPLMKWAGIEWRS